MSRYCRYVGTSISSPLFCWIWTARSGSLLVSEMGRMDWPEFMWAVFVFSSCLIGTFDALFLVWFLSQFCFSIISQIGLLCLELGRDRLGRKKDRFQIHLIMMVMTRNQSLESSSWVRTHNLRAGSLYVVPFLISLFAESCFQLFVFACFSSFLFSLIVSSLAFSLWSLFAQSPSFFLSSWLGCDPVGGVVAEWYPETSAAIVFWKWPERDFEQSCQSCWLGAHSWWSFAWGLIASLLSFPYICCSFFGGSSVDVAQKFADELRYPRDSCDDDDEVKEVAEKAEKARSIQSFLNPALPHA